MAAAAAAAAAATLLFDALAPAGADGCGAADGPAGCIGAATEVETATLREGCGFELAGHARLVIFTERVGTF